jgi:NAD(P)-dependent dehydrogenase (short-subunit alcohol dehydrogenase family)
VKRTLVLGGAALAARTAWAAAHTDDLRGRVALVTGGSRGLGFALCRELLAQGAHVATCARDAERLEEAARRLGGDLLARPCDVSDRQQIEAFVREVEDRLGPVDVLVNNAGVISVGPLETQTHADFEEMLAIQLWGTINTTLAVLPGMRERGRGRIANVTSVGGKLSVPWLLPYCTAKFAAVGFSEGLRAELAGTGVDVTTVVPGLMRTGSFVAAWFKGDRPDLEYGLFAALAATPGTTAGADRAARRIVQAIRRGEAEVALSLQAKLAACANGIAPGAVSGVLSLVGRALPELQGTQRRRGSEIDSPLDESLLTALGRKAARDLNQ